MQNHEGIDYFLFPDKSIANDNDYCILLNNCLLNAASINVGGLCSKLFFIPELEEFINKYSIAVSLKLNWMHMIILS